MWLLSLSLWINCKVKLSSIEDKHDVVDVVCRDTSRDGDDGGEIIDLVADAASDVFNYVLNMAVGARGAGEEFYHDIMHNSGVCTI